MFTFIFWFILSFIVWFFIGFFYELLGGKGFTLLSVLVSGYLFYKFGTAIGFGWAILIILAVLILIIRSVYNMVKDTVSGIFGMFR